MAIYFTSDLHLGHDRDFVWGARGFENLEAMETAIVERFNSIATDNDDVYLLGDSMLGDLEHSFSILKQLNGKKHFIIGNHDTSNRIKKYAELTEFPILYADVIKYKKRQLYLSHYPTEVSNGPECQVINLYGHTHQTHNFYEDRYYMYHVGMDSHDCYPVHIDTILAEIGAKKQETKGEE